jgi:O-antigen/teichoic acid export membrane protein
MIFANAALAFVHPSRGYLAGTGRFGRYGAQLATDGTLRAAGALVLLLAAVHSPSWYGWVLVFAQLAAVVVTVRGTQPPLRAADQGELVEPHLMDLARGIGWMLAGVLAAQVLANAGPIVVKVLAAPGDAAAGSFLTALVLARIPLFLFAALQASLLPGLARLFGSGQRHAVAVMMRRLLIVLAAVGALITLLLAALGPTITALLFGAGYRSDRAPLVLLSAACTVYMLAAAVAQVLLALHAARAVALGWWLGVLGFAAALPLHISLPIRVGLALLIGSVVAGLAFVALLRAELRG